MISEYRQEDDLLVLVKDKIAGIVAGQEYPAPGDQVIVPLKIYLIDLDPRNSDPQRRFPAPCLKLSPFAGRGGYLRKEEEEFAAQFIWYAADPQGVPSPVQGYRLAVFESKAIISKLFEPLKIGNFILQNDYKVLFGITDGATGGEFLAPYYHATFLVKGKKNNY